MELYKKILTILCSLSECLFFGGLTYGWAALVFVLKDRGFFTDGCNQTTMTIEPRRGDSFDPCGFQVNATEGSCPRQDNRLQLVFTVAAFIINATSFVMGPVYDKYGTRLVRIIFSIFLVLAFLMLAFSTPDKPYILFPAVMFMSSAGIMILFTNIQVGNLFGRWRSTVVTALSGSFDSSAFVMLLIKIGYDGGISMQTSFIILAVATLAFNINTWILLPVQHIPWPLPSNWGEPDVASKKKKKDVEEEEMKMNSHSEKVNGDYTGNDQIDNPITPQLANLLEREYPNVRTCLVSPMYVHLLIWLTVIQMRHWLFLGTFNSWINGLSCDESQVSQYTSVFASIQFCGILFAPLCGLLLDRNRKKKTSNGRAPSERTFLDDLQDCVLVFLVTIIITLLFCIMAIIPILEVQYITFVLQVLSRAFLYGLLAAFLATAFPMQFFGSLYGTTMLLSALFGLLNFPLAIISQRFSDGDPLYVNIFVLVLNMIPLFLPLYIHTYVKKKRVLWSQISGTVDALATTTT